ncbi:MAG TPA: NfeD family protein, partial [Spirochaetota bacterium]|nr:NfeD family protein [Spirochaetota bacterium]
IWFISGLVLLILEIFTAGFVVSLIGISCFVGGVVSIFTNNLIVQFLAFGVTMILLMIYIRPIITKYFNKNNNKKSTVDALIGKTCIVDTEIDNSKQTGYVKCGGDFWKAVSSDNSVISKGCQVVIEKMEGITVTVSLKKE